MARSPTHPSRLAGSFPPRPKHWSGASYDRAVSAGVFDHERLELIDGEIYEMSPMNDDHARAIVLGQYALLAAFPTDRFTVQVQIPFRLADDSRPEPDLSVFAGPPEHRRPLEQLPVLVFEIADSSLEYDRDIKLPRYAESAVPEVWILNLRARELQIHRDPSPATGYRSVELLAAGATVAPQANPNAPIPVGRLLP